MARRISSSPRTCARALLGIAVLVAVPWTASAESRTEQKPAGPLRTALAAVRVAPAAPTGHTARRAQAAANPALESPAFFKTRTGILVAGVMAAGVGYALYSTHHDRIHSAGKQ